MVKSIEEQFQDDLELDSPRIGAGDVVTESQEINPPPGAELELAVEAEIEFADLPAASDQPLMPSPDPLVHDLAVAQGIIPNPLTMLADALERGVDVEKLERLFDLAERHEKEVQRKQFAAALSDFQGDVPDIVDNKTAYVNTADGGSYSYQYADLDQIMRTIRPTLKATGLSVTYDTAIAEDGRSIKSLCYIMHRDGHTEMRTFVCPVDEKLKINDSQKVGSANAYASRYNVTNALGLTTGEDDDGAAGERSRGAPEPPKATDIDEFFPVGKHKGDKWDAVPLDYLEWVVANMTKRPDVQEKAKAQIEMRMDSQEAEPAGSVDGELSMAECARGITQAKTLDDLADVWTLVPDKHRDGLAAYHATRERELG